MLLTGIQLLFACPENHMDILLPFLFLSLITFYQKFHAKQICVLSSTMKLGPRLELNTGTQARGKCFQHMASKNTTGQALRSCVFQLTNKHTSMCTMYSIFVKNVDNESDIVSTVLLSNEHDESST